MFENDMFDAQKRNHDYFNNHQHQTPLNKDEYGIPAEYLNSLPEEVRVAGKVSAKETLAIFGGFFLLILLVFGLAVLIN